MNIRFMSACITQLCSTTPRSPTSSHATPARVRLRKSRVAAHAHHVDHVKFSLLGLVRKERPLPHKD